MILKNVLIRNLILSEALCMCLFICVCTYGCVNIHMHIHTYVILHDGGVFQKIIIFIIFFFCKSIFLKGAGLSLCMLRCYQVAETIITVKETFCFFFLSLSLWNNAVLGHV